MLGHLLRRRGIFSTSLSRLLHGMQDRSRQIDTTWKISGTSWAYGDVLPLLDWKRNFSRIPPYKASPPRDSYSKLEEDHVRSLISATLLSSLNAYNFRRQLEELPIERAQLDYEEFVQLARESGAATTTTDGHRLCEALAAAGVVLRYGNQVYINPEEIADEIRSCLPDSIEETTQSISDLEAELGPLQKEKGELDQKASRVSERVFQFGLFCLVAKLGLYTRLILYDLSWDVLSP